MKTADHNQAMGRVEYAECECIAGNKKVAHKIIDTQHAEEVGNIYLWRCQKCGKKSWAK